MNYRQTRTQKAGILIGTLLLAGIFLNACSDESTDSTEAMQKPSMNEHQKMMQTMNMDNDSRISLNLAPMQARHQLTNMRSHVQAVQSIIEHLSQDEFDEAAHVAHTKLGLTPEMKMMCSAFGNEEFQRLGFEFHANADQLGEILKTGDKNRSLQALSTTLSSCVTCHATFKQ